MEKQIENVLRYNALMNGKLEPAVLTYTNRKLHYGTTDLSDMMDSVIIGYLEMIVSFLNGKEIYSIFADTRNGAIRHASIQTENGTWKKADAKLFKLVIFGK